MQKTFRRSKFNRRRSGGILPVEDLRDVFIPQKIIRSPPFHRRQSRGIFGIEYVLEGFLLQNNFRKYFFFPQMACMWFFYKRPSGGLLGIDHLQEVYFLQKTFRRSFMHKRPLGEDSVGFFWYRRLSRGLHKVFFFLENTFRRSS